MYKGKNRNGIKKSGNFDKLGQMIQIGSTVRVGDPTVFDDYKEPFSGTVCEIMEERNTVLVRSETGKEFVADFRNISLLARADDSDTDYSLHILEQPAPEPVAQEQVEPEPERQSEGFERSEIM